MVVCVLYCDKPVSVEVGILCVLWDRDALPINMVKAEDTIRIELGVNNGSYDAGHSF
jgi:hypothetical protein